MGGWGGGGAATDVPHGERVEGGGGHVRLGYGLCCINGSPIWLSTIAILSVTNTSRGGADRNCSDREGGGCRLGGWGWRGVEVGGDCVHVRLGYCSLLHLWVIHQSVNDSGLVYYRHQQRRGGEGGVGSEIC